MANENTDALIKLGIVFTVGFGVYKIAKIFEDPNAHHQDETNINIETDIDKAIKAGQTPAYTDSQYFQMADLLQAAMEGMGTDEDAIFAVMNKMYSNLDVLLLLKAFGLRWYKEFAWTGENYNLIQWLQNELSTGDIENINNILAKRNITLFF